MSLTRLVIAFAFLARVAAAQTIGADQCCECAAAVCTDAAASLGLPCVAPCTLVDTAACADFVSIGAACLTYTPTVTPTRTSTLTPTNTPTETEVPPIPPDTATATPPFTPTPTPCANQVVTTTADSGAGSLRQAMLDACWGDTITFNIPTDSTGCVGDHCVITLASALPIIFEPITIDGTTQAGTSCGDLWGEVDPVWNVVVNANSIMESGFQLGGPSTTVRGIEVHHVAGNTTEAYGFEIGGANSVVQCNSSHDNWGGIVVTGVGSLVGGGSPGQGNVVYDNGIAGITLFNANTAAGNNSYDNPQGIFIEGGTGSLVGGTTSGERNWVHGNTSTGVRVIEGASSFTIRNNYIGTTRAGDAAAANTGLGINLTTSDDGIIRDNLVSGNVGQGLEADAGSSGNEVFNNKIGVEVDGTTELCNANPQVNDAGSNNVHDNTIGACVPPTPAPACCQCSDGTGVGHPGTTCIDNVFLASQSAPSIAELGGCDGLCGTILGGTSTADEPNSCDPEADLSGVCVAAATPVPPPPTPTPCADQIVTTTTDSNGAGTLRTALAACCNGSTVTVPAGTYTLSLGQLVVTSPCVIDGAGPTLTIIDANNASRAIKATADLTVNGVAFIHGTGLPSDADCEQYVCSGDPCGGALAHTGGFLTLTNCLFAQNAVVATNCCAAGGAVYSLEASAVTITTSVFSTNTATATMGSGCASGGAVKIYSPSAETATTFLNSTLVDNTVTADFADGGGGEIQSLGIVTLNKVTAARNIVTSGSNGKGGAFHLIPGTTDPSIAINSTFTQNQSDTFGGALGSARGDMTITDCTFSANTAPSGSAAWFNGGTYTIGNTIVNDTCLAQFGVTLTSAGYNIESGTSCGFTATGDQQNTNPLLGSLQNNGGDTDTMAITNTSPAFDAGGGSFESTDQRSVARPQFAAPDVGAYELAETPLATATPTGATATPAGPTETPTPVPTLSAHLAPPVSSVKWTAKNTAGTIISPPGCVTIVGWTLTANSGEVQITDVHGTVLAATASTASQVPERFGPCADTPISLVGTGRAFVGWH